MAKFEITETAVCFVTWTRTIEAESEDAALESFRQTSNGSDPVVGDSLGAYEPVYTVHEVSHGALHHEGPGIEQDDPGDSVVL
jgi:hypothetical protein